MRLGKVIFGTSSIIKRRSVSVKFKLHRATWGRCIRTDLGGRLLYIGMGMGMGIANGRGTAWSLESLCEVVAGNLSSDLRSANYRKKEVDMFQVSR